MFIPATMVFSIYTYKYVPRGLRPPYLYYQERMGVIVCSCAAVEWSLLVAEHKSMWCGVIIVVSKDPTRQRSNTMPPCMQARGIGEVSQSNAANLQLGTKTNVKNECYSEDMNSYLRASTRVIHPSKLYSYSWT
jgi:hypothetical protein